MGFAFHVPPRHHERGFFSPRLGEVAERLKAPHFCAVYGRPYRRFESFPSPPSGQFGGRCDALSQHTIIQPR